MSRWFRFYDEVLDDPKVQELDAADYRGWVNLLCVASRNNGRILEGKALAFALRMSEIDAGSLVDRLLIAGLIDRVKGGANGAFIAPHNWHKRQYKSDTSTDRVKRFRQRSETVAETAPDTEQNRTEEKKKTPYKKGVFSSLEQQAKTASERVFVEFNTTGWTAWANHDRAAGKIPKSPDSQFEGKNGWWFPSPMPPEIQAVRVA